MHNIVLEMLPEENANQHNYGRPTPHDAALYYPSGYVVKKAEKFSSCDDHKDDLLATDDVPPAAILTEVRSFVPGALQLPPKDLTPLFTRVESTITERTEDNVVFGDLLRCITGPLYYRLQEISVETYEGKLSDITDGELYRGVRSHLSMFDLTLLINTDGAPVFKSSKYSVWPVQVTINELPMHLRQKNVVVPVLWYEQEHADMAMTLETFVQQLDHLKSEGVTWNGNSQAIHSQVI